MIDCKRLLPITILALSFALPANSSSAASILPFVNVSMNGKVHANRKFWEKLKQKQAEREQQGSYPADTGNLPVRMEAPRVNVLEKPEPRKNTDIIKD